MSGHRRHHPPLKLPGKSTADHMANLNLDIDIRDLDYVRKVANDVSFIEINLWMDGASTNILMCKELGEFAEINVPENVLLSKDNLCLIHRRARFVANCKEAKSLCGICFALSGILRDGGKISLMAERFRSFVDEDFRV